MRFKPKQIFLLTIYVLFANETLKILLKEETWSPGRSTLNQQSISNKANRESLLFENTNSMTLGSERVNKETKPFMGPLCRRKDHVVYIKTHKTGSTTVAHIFWRYVDIDMTLILDLDINSTLAQIFSTYFETKTLFRKNDKLSQTKFCVLTLI